MRDEVARAISRKAVVLLIAGLCSALASAQNNSPVPAPVHVFYPAAAGQTPSALATVSATDARLLRTNGGATHNETKLIGPRPDLFPHGNITYVCAPNVDTTAPGTCNYLNTTIAGIYAARFTNANASIYIQFGITGLGGSTSGFLNLISYSTYRAALASDSSGDLVDVAALASLPGSEPAIFGGGSIEVTSALGVALGLSGMTGTTAGGSSCSIPSAGCYNGIITVTTPANLSANSGGTQFLYFRQNGGTQPSDAYDYYSVVEHETDEVLGTASCISTTSPMMVLTDGCTGANNASAVDLFRYQSPSTRVVQSTTPGAYFSYDGGNTNVAVYNTLANGNDYADWVTNCQYIQDAVGCLGQNGLDISNDGGVEIAVLDAVGYNATPVAPVISKAFSPAAIPVNGASTLTLTILNPNNFTTNLTGIGFTDILPLDVFVAGTPNLTNTCGGTASAPSLAPFVILSGGTLAAGTNGLSPGSTCTVSMSVTGLASGVYINTTLAVTSNEGGTGNTASATLTVLGPPSISKAFGVASIPLGGNTSLTFIITNPNSVSITGVSVGDAMPTGLTVTGSGINTCSGLIALSPNSVGLSGGAIAGGGSCTFSVTVTGTTPGVKNNVSGNVSANVAGAGNQASDTLDVIAPPVITKSFLPNKFIPGGTTTVSLSITNPNSFAGLTGVAFTDALPSGLMVATPNGLTSTCGGVATATAGSGTISLSGGSITASGSCTVTATVTAPEGIYLNSVQVTSTNGGTGNTSSATVYVATPPNLSKAFGELSIGAPASTTLTFTLMNPNHVVTLDALQFSDTLPAGLLIATPNGLTGSCGGTITAPSGNNPVTLSGATLSPQASCTVSVNVTSDGTVLGYLTNTTSTVTSTEALPGGAASATIFVGNPLQITYAANPSAGETPVNITSTGASSGGNICVSLYTFLPNAQMVSCCSCQIAPDALVTLGVNKDLTNNAVQNSVVIKLVSTITAGSCANVAGTAGSLANGAVAYATTLQPVGITGTYNAVNQRFISSTLSTAEYTQLVNVCSANFGGGGFCGSCNPAPRP
jgi:hypothetical protein